MDTQSLLLLIVYKNPEIKSVSKLLDKIKEEFGDDNPFNPSNINDNLSSLTTAGLLDSKAKITLEGLIFINKDKILSYANKNYPGQEEIIQKSILLTLRKDRGIKSEDIKKKIENISNFSLTEYFIFHLLNQGKIKVEKNLFFLV